MFDLVVGNVGKLHLLVDSGADISLLKSNRLLGTKEFEPRDRVQAKSVEGSVRNIWERRDKFWRYLHKFPSVSN